jgi:predicted metal-dependent hydrolase
VSPVSRVLHPILSAEERRSLFRQGIELFNQKEFFAAHEVLEEIWRSDRPEPRDLFQGIIQVAAAMHQFRDLHRTAGPRGTLAKARRRLEPFVPASHGLDVADLLASVIRWQVWLEDCEGEPPNFPAVRVLNAEALL